MSDIIALTFRLIVLSFIITKRQIIHNRTAQRDSWYQSYDFIVVGAGSAGCVVANRLTADPGVNLLLLEAGGAQDAINTDTPAMYYSIPVQRPDYQWVYYSEPEDGVGPQYPQMRVQETVGKLLGGSGSIGGMTYVRGNALDYDNWVHTYGAKGWSFNEVLPFFKRSENNTDLEIVKNNPGYHSTKGPVQISTSKNVDKILRITRQVLNDLGLKDTDQNGSNQTGTMIVQRYISQKGLRSGSANSFIDPNPHPNNLHILTKALVIKILFRGLTAVGVEFVRNDNTFRVFARKEVIITAGQTYNSHNLFKILIKYLFNDQGPIQSAQLLMLSGVGPRAHLEEFNIPVLIDLPVGNNFKSHVNPNIASEVDPTVINDQPQLSIDQLSQLYLNETGPLSTAPTITYCFSTANNTQKDWPNVYIGMYITGPNINSNIVLTRIRSKGTVRLQSTSPYISPKLNSRTFSNVQDFYDLKDAFKFTYFILERTSIAQYIRLRSFESIGCPPCNTQYMYECDQGLECAIRNTLFIDHPGGTCRMGNINRNDVVVGPDLKVKHAQNLRVCDSSIFPDLPNAPINAASVMVGEKCSQLIKDYHLINSNDY